MKKTIQVYCPYHAKKTLCDANIASYRGPGHSIQELFSSWVKKETIYNLTAPACGYLHGQKSGKFCRGWADHMHKILSLFVCYSTSEWIQVSLKNITHKFMAIYTSTMHTKTWTWIFSSLDFKYITEICGMPVCFKSIASHNCYMYPIFG